MSTKEVLHTLARLGGLSFATGQFSNQGVTLEDLDREIANGNVSQVVLLDGESLFSLTPQGQRRLTILENETRSATENAHSKNMSTMENRIGFDHPKTKRTKAGTEHPKASEQ